LRAFRLEIYRLRAVGEGSFGALKTRLNGRLRNLRVSNTQKEALLLVVYYALRVLLAPFRWFLAFTLQDLGRGCSPLIVRQAHAN